MTWRAILVMALSLASAPAFSREVIEHVVRTKADGIPEFTLLFRPVESGETKGVVCLSVLGSSVEDVRGRIDGGEQGQVYKYLSDWADQNGYAVVAWGARRLWDPSRNWNELARKTFRSQDAAFDALATAWERGMMELARAHSLPTSGYLMHGVSAAGQFALRLALRKPNRFLAVHAHVASSFDLPVPAGKSVLWCVTTGENEAGYRRSREFFTAAIAKGYPIIYKAYPGLGHTDSALADGLGLACFRYAVREREKELVASRGKTDKPNWKRIFADAPFVADIVNQLVARRENESRLPKEFRMPLPDGELVTAWRRE